MIAAVDILDEVETGVSALNGEIVRRAFHGHCCKFFNQQEEFKKILKQYIDHRAVIHRLKIQEDKVWNYYRRDRSYKDLAPNHYSMLRDRMIWANELRSKLKKIWPCAACIWLYNPTHRTRRFPQLI